MADWHYAVGQDQNGPISDEELHSLIKSGKIDRETYVWRDGMDNWQHAGEHPDLAKAFVSPPPPLPSVNPPRLPPPAFQPISPKPGALSRRGHGPVSGRDSSTISYSSRCWDLVLELRPLFTHPTSTCNSSR